MASMESVVTIATRLLDASSRDSGRISEKTIQIISPRQQITTQGAVRLDPRSGVSYEQVIRAVSGRVVQKLPADNKLSSEVGGERNRQ